MKNEILELFKAYEMETEWDGNAIPESMYNALANAIVKLYSKTNIKRVGIIGRTFGFDGSICGIDEAKTICIAHEHVVRYPILHLTDDNLPFKDIIQQERYISEVLGRPEVIEQFKNLSMQMTISAENIKSLSEELKVYEHKNKSKKEQKGHERPYKFHR